MRQSRLLAIGLAAAFLIAGCGTQNGPSTAENRALGSIPGAQKVLSYPIPLAGVVTYLPGAEGTVGAPAYVFTIRREASRKPLWVVAGSAGAKALAVYPDLAAAWHAAGRLHVSAAAFAAVGSGPLGRLKLQVIGAHLQRVAGARLRKLGLKLPGSAYDVLSVVTLPGNANASNLGVAHFVLSQGKVVGEYGGGR